MSGVFFYIHTKENHTMTVQVPYGWVDLVEAMIISLKGITKGSIEIEYIGIDCGVLTVDYCIASASNHNVEVFSKIMDYEHISAHTCTKCGAEGRMRSTGGNVIPMCNTCYVCS
jgi:hypothetical protein